MGIVEFFDNKTVLTFESIYLLWENDPSLLEMVLNFSGTSISLRNLLADLNSCFLLSVASPYRSLIFFMEDFKLIIF